MASARTYNIAPVAKPRMTRRDKWQQRPAVMRYRAFKDECRALGVYVQDGSKITFGIAMPASWGVKKRVAMRGTRHRQKPDIDNLLKAVFDALYSDDAIISEVHAIKVWAETAFMRVEAIA